ncbi:hypothetical protein AVEN_128667-1, partial [Araneus ventricosus]
MTRTTPELAPPLQACAPHRLETFGHYAWFSVQGVPCTADLRWSRVLGLEPSVPKAETLPLGRRGLYI